MSRALGAYSGSEIAIAISRRMILKSINFRFSDTGCLYPDMSIADRLSRNFSLPLALLLE